MCNINDVEEQKRKTKLLRANPVTEDEYLRFIFNNYSDTKYWYHPKYKK